MILPTITPVLDFDPLNPAIVVPNPTGLVTNVYS